MFAASRMGLWRAGIPPDADPLFSKVALLLHGDGTNGTHGAAAITDSSAAARVPGSAPAGITVSSDLADAFGGQCLKFSSGVLSYAHSSALAPPGDFCVDVRFWVPSVTGNLRLLCIKSTSTGHRTFSIGVNANGTLGCTTSNAAGTAIPINHATSNTVKAGWNRGEYSRIGDTFRCFLNGVLGFTATMSGSNYVSGSHPLAVGGSSDGLYPLSSNGTAYLEEFRITSGAGRNTSAYTPETAAFPNS